MTGPVCGRRALLPAMRSPNRVSETLTELPIPQSTQGQTCPENIEFSSVLLSCFLPLKSAESYKVLEESTLGPTFLPSETLLLVLNSLFQTNYLTGGRHGDSWTYLSTGLPSVPYFTVQYRILTLVPCVPYGTDNVPFFLAKNSS